MGQEHALLLGVHKILVLRADRIAAACGVRRRASGLIAR